MSAPAQRPLPLSLFVVSAPGLEPMLALEIEALTCPKADVAITEGGVALRGDLRTLYALNLELGLALKVLLRMGEFPARRFDVLVKRVADLPWETWLTADTPLLLRAQCKQSKLYHSGAVVERISSGISERLGNPITRVDSEESGPALTVQARLVHDVCTLSIDSSGELLHRRGYRKATGKAPLREDLARALVRASGRLALSQRATGPHAQLRVHGLTQLRRRALHAASRAGARAGAPDGGPDRSQRP